MKSRNYRQSQAQDRFKQLMEQLKIPPISQRFWLTAILLSGVLAWIVLGTPYDEGLSLGGLWSIFLGAALLGRLAWGWPLHRVVLVGLVGLVAMRGFIGLVSPILAA